MQMTTHHSSKAARKGEHPGRTAIAWSILKEEYYGRTTIPLNDDTRTWHPAGFIEG